MKFNRNKRLYILEGATFEIKFTFTHTTPVKTNVGIYLLHMKADYWFKINTQIKVWLKWMSNVKLGPMFLLSLIF
jgi:hypothetical protein